MTYCSWQNICIYFQNDNLTRSCDNNVAYYNMKSLSVHTEQCFILKSKQCTVYAVPYSLSSKQIILYKYNVNMTMIFIVEWRSEGLWRACLKLSYFHGSISASFTDMSFIKRQTVYLFGKVFQLFLKTTLFCFLWEHMRLKQEDSSQKPSYIQEMQEMEKKSREQANAVYITAYLQ